MTARYCDACTRKVKRRSCTRTSFYLPGSTGNGVQHFCFALHIFRTRSAFSRCRASPHVEECCVAPGLPVGYRSSQFVARRLLRRPLPSHCALLFQFRASARPRPGSSGKTARRRRLDRAAISLESRTYLPHNGGLTLESASEQPATV